MLRYKIQVSETLSETLHFHSPRHHQAWATSPGHGVSETLTRLSRDPYRARADGSRSRLTGWPCARRHGVWRRPAAFAFCCKQQSLGQPLCRPRTLHADPWHGHELRASTIIATCLLCYPAPLLVADVEDVVSRFCADDAEYTLKCPASGKRLLRRAEFCERVALLPRRTLTGGVLREADSSSSNDDEPPPSLAVEATWAALSGSAPYVSPQEVERQLSRWRPNTETFVLAEYERSLLQARASVAVGYVVLFGLQAMVLSLLVVQPLVDALTSGNA